VNEDFEMNNPMNSSPLDAELQVRLMNLVLGEASDFENDQLQLLMEQRPEVASYYQHLLHLHGLLSEVGTGELSTGTESDTGNGTWKLSTDRRNQVLAVLNGDAINPQSNSVASNPSSQNKWFWSSPWIVTGVALAACLVVAFMLPSVQMARVAPQGLSRRQFNSAREVDATPSYRMDADKSGKVSQPDGLMADASVSSFGSTAGAAGGEGQFGRPMAGQAESNERFSFAMPDGKQGTIPADQASSDSPIAAPKVSGWGVEKGYALNTPAADPSSQPAKPAGTNFFSETTNDTVQQGQPARTYSDFVDNDKYYKDSTAKQAADFDPKSIVDRVMSNQWNALRMNEGETMLGQKEDSSVDAMSTIDFMIQSNGVHSSSLDKAWFENSGSGQRGGERNGRVRITDGGDVSEPSNPASNRIPEFASDLGLPSSQGGSGNALPSFGNFDAYTPRILIPEEEELWLRDLTEAAPSESIARKELADGEQKETSNFKRLERGREQIEPLEEDLKALKEAGGAVNELAREPDRALVLPSITPASPEVAESLRFREFESRSPQNRDKQEAAQGVASTEGKDSKKRYDDVAVAELYVKPDQSVPSAYYWMDDVQYFAGPVRPQSGKKQKASVTLEEQSTATNAFSTFSLHVSDVSFKLAQAALNQSQWPEASKIRIEEFVNAIDYHDPLPTSEEKVACRVEQAIHPFLMQRNMLRISMRTAASGRAQNTPLRLTLLLDNSGSMEREDRRQAVYRAFKTLTQQLTAADQVTLISFASTPRLLADKVPGNQGEQLLQLIANLPSEGGTNIEAALQLAQEKATEQQTPGAQNRIVLMTDGAVNLGNANPDSLSKRVTQIRDTGIAFDAAGISTQDLNDEVLEALTRQGDGRYYLINSAEAAGDGFATQIAGALRPSAQNVKVQIEFNPQRVSRYKLLGFEKHRLKQEDFRNDQVDAAEMAAAEAGVAMYQFEAKPNGSGDVGNVSVRFRDLVTGNMVERRWPIPYEPSAPRLELASPSMQLATSAALLAAKLIGGPLADNVDMAELNGVLATLPEPFANQPRVQQLRTMIEQVRKM
jgi:Mg-chelatase subunit ChlD